MASGVREKIVSAALDRFHALGFNACGVQDIVDKAGVPKGTFYNYFKAKELLAVEVLGVYSEGSRHEMLADQSVAPLKRLKRHFEFLASRYAELGYDKGCLLGNLAAEMTEDTPLLREALALSLKRWADAVTVVLSEGQQDGSVAAKLNAAETARFLVNSWGGAAVRMKIVNDRQPIDDFLALVLPLLAASKPAAKKSAIRAQARTQ